MQNKLVSIAVKNGNTFDLYLYSSKEKKNYCNLDYNIMIALRKIWLNNLKVTT